VKSSPLLAATFLLSAGLALEPAPAAAGASFGYLYGVGTLEKGEWEVNHWVTSRRGRSTGEYHALDLSTEIEYGIGERFQTSLYLNAKHHDIDGVTGSADRDKTAFQGIQLAFKWNVIDPERRPIGFALYVEPGFQRIGSSDGTAVEAWQFETKLLFERRLTRRATWVAAVTFEPEFERPRGVSQRAKTSTDAAVSGRDFERALGLEFATGVALQLTDRWAAGLEWRTVNEYSGISLSDREYTAHYVGPNLHFDDHEWWFTLTVLPQVGESRPLDQSEKLETRLRFGVEF
jgi:hypothetical protein